MGIFRELFRVAWSGLIARKTRTALIMLGPIVGVAAMVGAVGLTESAKGDLKEQLARLGTDLVIVNAGQSFGPTKQSLPADSVNRVRAVTTTADAAAAGELSGVRVLPNAGSDAYFQALPVPVLAADANLPNVLKVAMTNGHWLGSVDDHIGGRAVVLGSALAHQYTYLRGEVRTVRINNIDYGVIGVLGKVELDPSLDTAVFISQGSAKRDFNTDGKPTKIYVRAKPGTAQKTADATKVAVYLGGSGEVSTSVPSDVLKASAQADHTLQQTALFAGLLALAVGGLGIANVMSISVIQRSPEIGIRRALGHGRGLVGIQFLAEALFVGLVGALLGCALGVGIVYLISSFAHWVVVVAYNRVPIWVGLALAVSVAAGLYPSVKAARLEPLETLRLG